jgi:hypothetical protein
MYLFVKLYSSPREPLCDDMDKSEEYNNVDGGCDLCEV